MQFTPNWQQLNQSGGAGRPRTQSIFVKILAVAASIVMAVSFIALSIVAFAVVAVVGLIAGAYLWWKTRHVRAQLKQAQAAHWQEMSGSRSSAARDDATIIEGEVVRVEVSDEVDGRNNPQARR